MKKVTIAHVILLSATYFAKKEKSAKGADLLRELESNFAAEVAKHGHDAFLTYFAEDGVELVDGGGINTKDTMRKQPPWPEGTTLSWTPVYAEMAASSDLGYTYRNYVYTANNNTAHLAPNTPHNTPISNHQNTPP